MSRLPGIVSVSVLLLAAAPGWSAEPDGRALLDKIVKAHGGWEHLGKARAVDMKLEGLLHQNGVQHPFTGEIAFQLPDRLRIHLEVPVRGGRIFATQVLKGEEGWFNSRDRGVRAMRPSEVAEARHQLHTSAVTRLGVLNDKAYKVTLLPETKINDRPVVGLLVRHDHGRDVRLYFDKESLMLVKSATRGRNVTGGAEFDIETFYDDHKKIDDIPEPHRIRIRRDDRPYLDATVTSIKLSEKLPDKLFEQPANK